MQALKMTWEEQKLLIQVVSMIPWLRINIRLKEEIIKGQVKYTSPAIRMDWILKDNWKDTIIDTGQKFNALTRSYHVNKQIISIITN